MNVHQALEYVQTSEEYKEFAAKNPDYRLAHCFMSLESGKTSDWELGFYSSQTDKIVVFVADESVALRGEEEAFKESGHIDELDLEAVTTSFDDVMERVESVREEKVRGEPVNKTLVIVQVLNKKTVWNVTLITAAFNLLNVRVDAGSGEIVSSDLSSIMKLGKQA